LNIKYVSIWNIGDDSFDLDQGFRGKAQFGLIVQGFCGRNSQGSGIGDNCFEMDGAESAAAQPFGAASIKNFTVIGQPHDGDQGTEWRDNMRAQLENCIFMNVGGRLVRDGGDGGDGGGYGSPGVPTLAELFATPFDVYPENTVGVAPEVLYPNFTSGNWCQITHSLFYENAETASLDEFGVMDEANGNAIVDEMPITEIVRADAELVKDKIMASVTYLNPLAAGAAVNGNKVQEDNFFTPVSYIGGFGDYNWLQGWTAADAYGMTN
jgi:hypothetical protein